MWRVRSGLVLIIGLSDNGNLHINDPANKTIYEAHLYFDANGSGTYKQTYDQQGANPNIGSNNVKPFLDWLKAHKPRIHWASLVSRSNDPKWIPVLKNFINTLQANGISGTYWDYVYADPSGKNPWWPNGDPLSIWSNNGQNTSVLDVISAHNTNAGSPTSVTYTVAGTPGAPTNSTSRWLLCEMRFRQMGILDLARHYRFKRPTRRAFGFLGGRRCS